MTDPVPERQVTRTATWALLHALPAIVLISLILWTSVGTAATLTAMTIDLDILGIALALILFVPPGVWANWHVVRHAVAAERVPD